MAYQKIDDSFWTDPDVIALDIESTLLLLYLMTRIGGHYSGIYFATEAAIAEGSKLSLKGLEKAMKILSDWIGVISNESKPFVKYDKRLQVVWVVNMTKHQVKLGNRCNQIIGINKHLKTLHNSFLVAEYCKKYKALSADIIDKKTGELLRTVTVELPEGIQPPAFELLQPFPGGTVTVSAPGDWTLSKPLPGVKLTQSAEGFVLKVPTGLKAVTVVSGN